MCAGRDTSGGDRQLADLTHIDEQGRARMVDVGAKQPTTRVATARATLRMAPATAAAIADGTTPKGDVTATARIAGLQAAKKTSGLIPLCHPVPLDFLDVGIEVQADAGLVTIEALARAFARTGVEMEALTAVTVAALTVYDMVKGLERGVEIAEVVLLSKTGGKSDWQRDER